MEKQAKRLFGWKLVPQRAEERFSGFIKGIKPGGDAGIDAHNSVHPDLPAWALAGWSTVTPSSKG